MSPDQVILPGVDRYRVMEPWFEGVRVILSYRGEPYSPAYIQGITGTAFRVAGPCPCAPTCGHALEPDGLVRLLGYEAEGLPVRVEGVDAATRVRELVARVKDEVQAGRPTLVWHAFTFAEWDVVCGFDESGHFHGRGSYAGLDGYAVADEGRLATCDVAPSLGVVLIGGKSGELEREAAERAALAGAIRHARTPEDRVPACGAEGPGDWRFRNGLGCYDWWIGSFRAAPPKVPNMGDRYCLGVFRSTHWAGAGFLRELATSHPSAAGPLAEGAQAMAAEAEALNACAELLFPGWELPQEADGARNAQAAALLEQARGRYAQAIDAIEVALSLL